MCVRMPQCAITCSNSCAHVKHPTVLVRDWWVTKRLKHTARTVGLDNATVAAGFLQGKQHEFHMGEIPMGQYSCKIKYVK